MHQIGITQRGGQKMSYLFATNFNKLRLLKIYLASLFQTKPIKFLLSSAINTITYHSFRFTKSSRHLILWTIIIINFPALSILLWALHSQSFRRPQSKNLASFLSNRIVYRSHISLFTYNVVTRSSTILT